MLTQTLSAAVPVVSISKVQDGSEPATLKNHVSVPPVPLIYRVTRSFADGYGLTVFYHASPGSVATPGVDVDLLSDPPSYITIPANQTTADIYVNPIMDIDCEPTESLTVVLDSSPNASYALGTASASANLANVNSIGHTLTAIGSTIAYENSGQSFTVRVTRSCGNPDDWVYDAVIYVSSLSTANQGNTDAAVPLFVRLQRDVHYVDVTFPILDDNLQEAPTETLILSTTPFGYGPTYHILDNESCTAYTPGNVTITSGDAEVQLSWDTVQNAQQYRIRRAAYDVNGVLGAYSTVAQIAAPNSARASYSDRTVVNGTRYSYTVATYGGTCSGGPNYSPESPAQDATPGSQNVTISVVGASTFTEPFGTPTLRLTRATASPIEVTVNLSYSGTATRGQDYSGPSTVKILANQTTADFTLAQLDDNVTESTETIVVTVAAGTGYHPGSPASATITILDNDPSAAPMLTATAGNNQIYLSWSAIPGASSYVLERLMWPDIPPYWQQIAAGTTATSFRDDDISNGRTMTYHVAAKFPNNTLSPFSQNASATPQNFLRVGGSFNGSSSFVLNITGLTEGHRATVETSADLATWTTPQNLTFSGTTATYTDNGVGFIDVRFYRIRSGDRDDSAAEGNIFGFTRVLVPHAVGGTGGFALVGIQLDNPANTLQSYFAGVPNGAKVYFWNETTREFDVPCVFSSSTGWSQNGVAVDSAPLQLGTAVFVWNPNTSDIKVTFVGSVPAIGGSTSVPAGYSARSAFAPQSHSLTAFGFTPGDGETVYKFDKTTQSYETHDYDLLNPGGWGNNVPFVDPGEGVLIFAPSAHTWSQRILSTKLSINNNAAKTVAYVSVSGQWYKNFNLQYSYDGVTWYNLGNISTVPGNPYPYSIGSEGRAIFRINSSGVGSINAVGFHKVVVWANQQDFVANQTDAGVHNNLEEAITEVPAGTKFYKWNEAIQNYDPAYIKGSDTHWYQNGLIANTSLAPGEGGDLVNLTTSPMNVTFFGQIQQGHLDVQIPNGMGVRSAKIPFAIATDTGYFPTPIGMEVQVYNPSTGYFTDYSWDDLDNQWWPSSPQVGYGHSFFTHGGATWRRNYSVW